MPRFTPDIKVSGTRALGAEIVLHGDSLAEARARARELATAEQLEFIHPYNDEAIMAGQGTVGLEMLRQQPELEVLLVPVGGGGLLSGIATAAKALNPEIQVIGVQMQRFPAVVNAMTGSHHGFGQDTIAEGIAVARPGEKCLESIRRHVDDFLLVDESDVEEAIVMLLEIEKTVVEGAGAAPLAALLRHRQRFFGKKVGIVLSGGNVDPQLLSQIIGRGLVRSGRMARITVSTRDVPGALARITALVAESGANVEQVIHQRAFTLLAARNVEVEMVLHTRDIAHVAQVSQHLQDQGFEVRVMHPRDARLPQ